VRRHKKSLSPFIHMRGVVDADVPWAGGRATKSEIVPQLVLLRAQI
jgi:hypothetical protein